MSRPQSPQQSASARNPVLPGFYPDPSVCRVGDDYYLVNSSFEYFPGLPLHHSRDLVHWRPIGHAMDRPEQLPLDGVRPSGGLYAPALTHHDGRFHLVCTLVDGTRESGTFLLTADDPAGPWSDPLWLPEAPGFDPSLFFDDDGSAHLLGTRQIDQAGHTEIWMRALDPAAGRLTGPEHILFRGALVDAVWAEGPHLIRHDGYYYLLLAEGGTFHEHAVTVARSHTLTGPYENNPRNPVLTHRHLGRAFPVTGTGHADLVRTQHGDWYALLLASRPSGGDFVNLGRETFLARVVWEDGWPVVNPGVGRLEETARTALEPHPWPAPDPVDHFDAPELGPQWNLLRTPRTELYSLTERPGHLRLRLLPETLDRQVTPAFVGRRQQHLDFTAETELDFEPGADEQAGLVLLQNHDFHIRLTVTRTADGAKAAWLTVRSAGADIQRAELPLAAGPVRLAVRAHGQDYTLLCSQRPDHWETLATVDGRVLSSSVADSFTGAYVGLYGTGPAGGGSPGADFDWFRYAGADRPWAAEHESAP
ncbi:glycoside hydrolase family 43 protein [Streptomyces sp. NPDC092296]|uniref:glycoside hydrolase family 43 protein n=1 Tax=Streptomyces sp. NPDC092296 TaxID=3366012 RepID=UPI003800055F